MDSELIEGSGGVFIVSVDGDIVYDKKETGRFPNEGEVTQLMKA